MRKILLSLVVFALLSPLAIAQQDSLRLTREGEKAYVIHKVIAKQTLFALAERYQTTIDAIRSENPMVASGLQIGQTLKIPFGGALPDQEPAEEKNVQYVMHKVGAGETLFSIAKAYEVNVTDLKKWNDLPSNAISLDQELKVLVSEKQISGGNALAEVKIEGEPNERIAESNKDSVSFQGTPFEQVVIEGIAEVIEEEEPSSKFFALHRTAEEGTVIKVRNLMNDLTVYVRVIGTIPATSNNENVIIKLNQRAYENLKAIDKRFRVELSYFQ